MVAAQTPDIDIASISRTTFARHPTFGFDDYYTTLLRLWSILAATLYMPCSSYTEREVTTRFNRDNAYYPSQRTPKEDSVVSSKFVVLPLNVCSDAWWLSGPCIRGHRSTKCQHTDRVLLEVRKPGRPLTSCPHIAKACSCERLIINYTVPNSQ